MASFNVSPVASTSRATVAATAALVPATGQQYSKQHRSADILCVADDLATTWLDEQLGFSTHKTHAVSPGNLTCGEVDVLCRQKSLYSDALDVNSMFQFQRCYRYSNDGFVGAKVVATVRIDKGKLIPNLCGYMVKVDESFIKPGFNDFSVVYSSYRKSTSLWLGPAAYVNHDCDSNCVIYSVNGQLACVRATKTVQPGDEITVNYGSSYFNPQECQCVTCETKSCGSFASRQSPEFFECHFCGHRTAYKSWLARHVARHMGKKHSCSFCNRTYSCMSALRRHEKCHLGVTSFPCDLCNRNFTRQFTLAVHVRTTHSGAQNRSKCPDCPRSFKHYHDLKYHRNRTHTGAKPYVCNVCGESFHAPTNMYKHQKRAH